MNCQSFVLFSTIFRKMPTVYVYHSRSKHPIQMYFISNFSLLSQRSDSLKS